MQVRCPHCASVFPSDRAGTQFCPRCGAQIHVPEEGQVVEAGLPPFAPGAPPEPSGAEGPGPGEGPTPALPPGVREPTPWERRRELGLFKAVVETWKASVLSPRRFWPSVRPEAPWTEALLYGWLIGAVTSIASIPLRVWQQRRSVDELREAAERLEELPARLRDILRPIVESAGAGTTGDVVAQAILGALLWPVGFIILAAVLHLCCLLVGASRGGFGATARAVGYAWGPMVILYLPFIGWLGWVYAAVLAAWGVKELHETTWERAVGAVVIPFVVVCCFACCLGMAGVGAAFSSLRASP
ncbi:MAG: YIP1 family protein [Myxococcaceae bacterium]|nr:YIP1 family protein [Myxococcaceae bacterium]MCI0673747.1 YIP1 family protein [Myxococcaceae bacterium]